MGEQERISGATAVLAIIGDPIDEVRSPRMVNAKLAHAGKTDCVMVPLHVKAPQLASVVNGLRGMENFRGAIVTMPHKKTVLGLLDRVSESARNVGACNILRRENGGTLSGTVLDGEGFLAGLRRAGHDVRTKRVFIAGAGGAATAIAFAVGESGATEVAIYNRTRARGEELVRRLTTYLPNLDVRTTGRSPDGFEIAVNATSLGMRESDDLPFDISKLGARTLVADVVIYPESTRLLSEAKKRGCQIHPGCPMLEEQIQPMIDYMLAPLTQ